MDQKTLKKKKEKISFILFQSLSTKMQPEYAVTDYYLSIYSYIHTPTAKKVPCWFNLPTNILHFQTFPYHKYRKLLL